MSMTSSGRVSVMPPLRRLSVPPSSLEAFRCSMTWCTSLETDMAAACVDEAILGVVPEEQGREEDDWGS